MSTNLYVSFTTAQVGNEADETGINLNSISVRYFPQWKKKIDDFSGQVRGFAIPNKLSREVTITGEVIVGSTSGLMSAQFVVALTLANDVTDFLAVTGTANTGGLYVDEATVDQSRDGWRTLNMKLSSDPGVS